ncbi:hypothetical protein BDP55DRAFT_253832 [Colletotrichum godetiae]|uniref:Uncharacterized protein n=1 Tax=Colletotrichum godetiae TaxID=1209918 RepID=A0AAJ0EUK2_9PEZI|nr:uncharacterized protein BDP55DRAFT_253832 [Colletotrichum godetiae]KAK1672309.1 hypothetical protein BDP55DRAFT_253832 [Colletotrichum godetiae]
MPTLASIRLSLRTLTPLSAIPMLRISLAPTAHIKYHRPTTAETLVSLATLPLRFPSVNIEYEFLLIYTEPHTDSFLRKLLWHPSSRLVCTSTIFQVMSSCYLRIALAHPILHSHASHLLFFDCVNHWLLAIVARS